MTEDIKLLKTTQTNEHYHIVYLRDEMAGITSIDDEHSHELKFKQSEPAVMNEFGLMIREGWQGGWFIYPDADGHTHELQEYEIKEDKIKEKSDKDKAAEVLENLFDDMEREKDSRINGEESKEFVANKQWDDEQKRKLEGTDRAAHTINVIADKINTLDGYQRQNRTEIKYLPSEKGDQRISDIANIIVKNDILNKCFYGREKSKVFRDASITGRGLFHCYEDLDKDIRGEIIIEKFQWNECYFGVHNKEDLNDCDRIEKVKWYSEDVIKAEYPDKFKKISGSVKSKDVQGIVKSEDWDKRLKTSELYNNNNYRVIEQEKKEYKRVYVLANVDGYAMNTEGWKDTDINKALTIEGFRKIPRKTYKIKITKVCMSVLLDEYYTDDEDFSIFPLYAELDDGVFWGKVEAVKDLQRLLNKAYSQFSDILNKVSNYGWFYDSDTFPDKKKKEEFQKNASSPGFLQEITNIDKQPVKVEGLKFPQELIGAIGLFANTIREIMNINLDLQGMTGGQQSGIALRQKIVQQLIGNDFLFDNMSFVEKKIGKVLIKKMQKLYTPKRILRILQNQNMKAMSGKNQKPLNIGGKPFTDYTEQEIMELLSTKDLIDNDVIISESPESPSAMMSSFLMLSEFKNQIPIPPEAIFEFAPLPQEVKDKISELIAQQMQTTAAQEQGKQQTEIQKTLIAANSKTQGRA